MHLSNCEKYRLLGHITTQCGRSNDQGISLKKDTAHPYTKLVIFTSQKTVFITIIATKNLKLDILPNLFFFYFNYKSTIMTSYCIKQQTNTRIYIIKYKYTLINLNCLHVNTFNILFAYSLFIN